MKSTLILLGLLASIITVIAAPAESATNSGLLEKRCKPILRTFLLCLQASVYVVQ
ncbi:hypothetical protein BDR22DRAFT_895737 [Usnea florida]